MAGNLVNVADMQTHSTLLIMAPQTPDPADDVSDRVSNIQQGKMFNQMEDKSFSEMKLFTNTKE